MLAKQWRRFRRTRGPVHEVVTLALALVLGLAVAPALVYVVGDKVMGPYANGGYLSLLADIFKAMGKGALPFWLLVLGPYAAVWMWRLLRWSWR